ncbi:MAG: hypothetical protein OQK01_06765 [Xanthomonadales bacterium]|nr:hypothetical protein [Xanthomonadales bacterium]
MQEAVTEAATAAAEQPAAEPLLVDLKLDIGPWLPDSMQPFWAFLQDYPLLLVVILAALGYLVGKGLQWALRHLLERITQRTKSDLDDRLGLYLTKPVVQTTIRPPSRTLRLTFGDDVVVATRGTSDVGSRPRLADG